MGRPSLFSLSPVREDRKATFFPSCDAVLFPTVNDTMPDSTSMTRGSQTIEMGGVRMDDEAELARMGYKQELKYIQVNFMRPCPSKIACAVVERASTTGSSSVRTFGFSSSVSDLPAVESILHDDGRTGYGRCIPSTIVSAQS